MEVDLTDSTLSFLTLLERESVAVSPRIPGSTYRVQLQPAFGFDEAARIVPYLAELGIDTIYASPHFHSAPGSTHGYDVIDPTALNEELGGEAAYGRLHQALRAHGIGMLIDIVPNHMGISGGANPYWQDILQNGLTSPYAEYFDIDWEVVKPEQRDKVLLPILGEFYGVVLENGELRLRYEAGQFTLWYYEMPFPIAPPTYGQILRLVLSNLNQSAGVAELSLLEFESILAAFERLPPNSSTGSEEIEERRREQTVTIRRLDQLTEEEPVIRAAINVAIDQFDGRTGLAESFDLLDQLLEAQSYRLAYWRVAGEEINYRRFFAINELAAVRQELPEVFSATHTLVAKLIAEGYVDGLRIDHIDGLWNPQAYLQDLQCLAFLARVQKQLSDSDQWESVRTIAEAWWRGRWIDSEESRLVASLYIVVEKILQPGEQMPSTWPIAGSTGYEFARIATQLFIDPAGERAFTQWYERFTGRDESLEDVEDDAKHLILREAFSSELTVLAAALDRLSERRRRTRDFTLNNLRFALQEVISSFPTYRTYIDERSAVRAHDRRTIEHAINKAIKRNPSSDRSVFAFVRDMLIGGEMDVNQEDEEERLRFAMRFQQLTGPVMAKGVEDTAFYRNYRLTALNEVGGDLGTFGITPVEFHRQVEEQQAVFAHGLLASSTHDTKRSEDVRARIATLSEFPREWRAAVNRWSRLIRKHRSRVSGKAAPSRNDESHFFQSLAGLWPSTGSLEEAHVTDRLSAYMLKAAREAQEETSWINPNEEYEESLERFVRRALDPARSTEFIEDFARFNQEVSRAGALTSLSMQLLKLTCPGVPDVYQGTEVIDLALVDPDNRHPVDFERLADRLRSVRRLTDNELQILANNPEDGEFKLFLTATILQVRQAHRELMSSGDYRPLAVSGELADHVVAFERRLADQSLIVVAPRLVRQLLRRFGDSWLSSETWERTTVQLTSASDGRSYFNPLSRNSADFCTGAQIPVGELLSGLPVACWIENRKEGMSN